MADRITTSNLANVFQHWANAFGFRISRGWNTKTKKNDPGFVLEAGPMGGYSVVELHSEHSGQSEPFGSRRYTARELYDMLVFAMRSMDRKRRK